MYLFEHWKKKHVLRGSLQGSYMRGKNTVWDKYFKMLSIPDSLSAKAWILLCGTWYISRSWLRWVHVKRWSTGKNSILQYGQFGGKRSVMTCVCVSLEWPIRRRGKIISWRWDKRLDDIQGMGRDFSCASLFGDGDCFFQCLNHCFRTNWRRYCVRSEGVGRIWD